MVNRKKQARFLTILTGICAFLIVLLLVLVFGKNLVFKRYTNHSSGITMQYPYDWIFKENPDNQPDALVIFLSPKDNAMDFFQENFNVVRQNLTGKPQNLNVYSEEAIKQVKAVFKAGIEVLTNEEMNLAGGRPAHKFEYLVKDKQFTFHILHIWTIVDGTSYQLTFTSLDSQFIKYFPKVQHMINSFRLK